MIDLRTVIATAIADALNDQLDDGYDIFGDGVDYDTLDISVEGDTVVIGGLGPDHKLYAVRVLEQLQ